MKNFRALIIAIAVMAAVYNSRATTDIEGAAKTDMEAERAALLNADIEFSKASATGGIPKAFLAYLADDATVLIANENPIKGKEALRAFYLQTPSTTTLNWQPFQAEVAKSGDL